MMTRTHILAGAAALAAGLAVAQPASAAVFEFSELADPNGASGGSNEATWGGFTGPLGGYAGSFDTTNDIWTVDGIGVKASATNDATAGTAYYGESEAYLDGYSGGLAGLGVCSTVNSSFQCGTGSDDNTGRAGDTNSGVLETLILAFSTSVSLDNLIFRDRDHNVYGAGALTIDLNGTSYTHGVTDLSGFVGQTFAFARIADGEDFYLDTATVSAVPLPAAAWFLLTALGGLVGTRWLKKGEASAAA
ncbi:VPLPA-CTERM sorting domain-containing protein [Roseospira navarrensis]|uniref:VPLPA-CTERM sorting domain-containing protein n=1 Tax=Roseospira navarrensis TaxID=140058 RepID=A0A7X1ZF49_9PROT|nr:VPLPA-CTERM sorting domain-containing protein [Roseospira navarrensis]MQX36436.1 VPLPA-CTERM sorting domain-containing protein [Roseospira navarrensis]